MTRYVLAVGLLAVTACRRGPTDAERFACEDGEAHCLSTPMREAMQRHPDLFAACATLLADCTAAGYLEAPTPTPPDAAGPAPGPEPRS